MPSEPATTPAAPPIDRSTRLELHELIIRLEDEHAIAGRVATETFVALPVIGGRALELLAREPSIGDAEDALRSETETDVDLAEFAHSLMDLGFIRAVDDRPLGPDETLRSSLPWLGRKPSRWLFSAPAKLVFAVLVVAGALSTALDPSLLPRPSDFFWSQSTSLVLVGNTVMFLGALALHEVAHLAAARSVGASGRFSLGTRLHLLVAQTDMTGLWAVARRERYRTYLAGMSCDLVLLSIAVLALAHLAMPADLHRLLSAFVLLLIFGLGRQLQLYTRTDVYFVLADLLRAKNLMEDAAAYTLSHVRRCKGLLKRPRRLQPARDVLRALSPRERRNVQMYAPIMVIGSAVALSFAALYGLPIILDLSSHAIEATRAGATQGDAARLADGLITLCVQASFPALFALVLIRNRAARTRAVLRRLKTAA